MKTSLQGLQNQFKTTFLKKSLTDLSAIIMENKSLRFF